VPPDVTWPLPELAAGAALGLKPLVPADEWAGPGLALGRLAEGTGATGRTGTDGAVVDVRCKAGLWVGVDVPAACVDPGRMRTTAPAVTTLPVVAAVVIERMRAWPRSLALIAPRALSRFALLIEVTAGEVMQGS
jgi:hypothetical protein